MKLANILSISLNVASLGIGRAGKMCLNLDLDRDLTMVILPIAVKFLGI